VIIKPVLPVVARLIAMFLPVISHLIAALLPVLPLLVPVTTLITGAAVLTRNSVLECIAALFRCAGRKLAGAGPPVA
jgi:phage-related protein